MQPTKGEVNLYNKIKGRKVIAIKGNSSAGEGWRPVCAGHYLGNQCMGSEKDAIAYGVRIVEQLKARVLEETPPVLPVVAKKKRNSKKQEQV